MDRWSASSEHRHRWKDCERPLIHNGPVCNHRSQPETYLASLLNWSWLGITTTVRIAHKLRSLPSPQLTAAVRTTLKDFLYSAGLTYRRYGRGPINWSYQRHCLRRCLWLVVLSSRIERFCPLRQWTRLVGVSCSSREHNPPFATRPRLATDSELLLDCPARATTPRATTRRAGILRG